MRKRTKSYIFLLVALLLLMSMPRRITDNLREIAVFFFSPAWTTVSKMQPSTPTYQVQIQRLQIEKELLQQELGKLQALLQQENFLEKQTEGLTKSRLKTLSKKHRKELRQQLESHLLAVPAQVIFRSPALWSSTIWINVGTADNERLGSRRIAKNSPVVIGNAVIGVIDSVGKQQSRVRLITDSGLSPSVRAVRGGSYFLAKGELHGSGQPLWRSRDLHLKGIGFNYDFADEEGPARDLRSGLPLNKENEERIPIIQVNDLLVTTGMDGVFPAGLQVAHVTKIHKLREGDYYYDIEALPVAQNLNELTHVFVLPVTGYDPADQGDGL